MDILKYLEYRDFQKEDQYYLKDFHMFLTIYLKMSDEQIKDCFENVFRECRWQAIRIMLESSIDDNTDEEIVAENGELLYEEVSNFCRSLEYPEERAIKCADIYKEQYQLTIKEILKKTPIEVC
jgi:hypothetical protein